MHDIFPESIWYLQLVYQISASYEVWNPEKKLVTYAHTYAHALHYYIDLQVVNYNTGHSVNVACILKKMSGI